MVLAKNAAKIAMAEKHVADAPAAAKRWLLAPMQGDCGNRKAVVHPAEAVGSDGPVRPALPGAKTAIAQRKRGWQKRRTSGHKGCCLRIEKQGRPAGVAAKRPCVG
jgi:hypothetical protein